MAIGKSIVDVLKSITGKNVETIADGLEEALSGGGSGGGGVLVVTATYDAEAGTYTLNKTWQEIHDADLAVISTEYTNAEDEETGIDKSFAIEALEWKKDEDKKRKRGIVTGGVGVIAMLFVVVLSVFLVFSFLKLAFSKQ